LKFSKPFETISISRWQSAQGSLQIRAAAGFPRNAAIERNLRSGGMSQKPKGAMIRRTTVFILSWPSSPHLFSGAEMTR
jgi:hypothetical protein